LGTRRRNLALVRRHRPAKENMMAWEELSPPIRQGSGANGTGVKMTIGDRGISVTVSGKALAHLGGPGDGTEKFKIKINREPGVMLLRVSKDKGGLAVSRSIRLGKMINVGNVQMTGAACSWESIDDEGVVGIDIDLPRELMPKPVTHTSVMTKPNGDAHVRSISVPGKA
jgi:hypothetical protein